MFSLDFTPVHSAGEIAMAPKRKKHSSVVAIIPPIDPNSQLPFAGNHMSVILEFDLLHLVDVGVLPPKELYSWRICRGVTVPMEDTHESVIYVPFLIRGLALPVSPFFCGLLDFYNLNLTHLNPNSILQVSIFIHLCEAYLKILPHFGLWKYLYHYRPGMAGGQHQLVGGASLELRRERKSEYLDIPLKDSIKGWRLKWFIVENHCKSLPPRSGRQPDVRTPSWVESPTPSEVIEAKVLLAECDSPPKLSGPHAPILTLLASDGCARVPGNLTRLSSSPTGTHHPKDLPHNMFIIVITFDTHTLEIERKTFTKYTLHSRTQVLHGRMRCIYYKS
jgi:hypothetical protein